ncbi:uncharacterized protein LOC128777999 [Panthera pardus]|uniref:Uncharacterized protein LOC128777999 n=1 Tax=Panthera pardus TaxID=9691 RepID=A0A9W2VRZ7_PANPR|nr:uncharacterized protein LOC128777999 [Panthera pardus]
MLIASRVSVCVREQSERVSPSRSGSSKRRLLPPPSARSRPPPPVPSWGVSAWVGPPGPQGSLLRLPSARATCVAAPSPSWGGRNLGGQTGQDGPEDEEREPARARDRQEVPTAAAATAAAAAAAAAAAPGPGPPAAP